MISVAIDGPAGAGKSTIARAVAEKLGLLYIDTGALYRSIGLAVLREGKDPAREEDTCGCLPGLSLALRHENGAQQVYLNGENVSEKIRTPEVSMAASQVSAFPAVRAFLLEQQRDLARKNSVIMDGRDIGTVVLPDADLKIFLTARPEDRARRRYLELCQRGEQADEDQILQDVLGRDRQDMERAVSPLCPAPDAVVADTTGKGREESFQLLLELVQAHLGEAGGMGR